MRMLEVNEPALAMSKVNLSSVHRCWHVSKQQQGAWSRSSSSDVEAVRNSAMSNASAVSRVKMHRDALSCKKHEACDVLMTYHGPKEYRYQLFQARLYLLVKVSFGSCPDLAVTRT